MVGYCFLLEMKFQEGLQMEKGELSRRETGDIGMISVRKGQELGLAEESCNVDWRGKSCPIKLKGQPNTLDLHEKSVF